MSVNLWRKPRTARRHPFGNNIFTAVARIIATALVGALLTAPSAAALSNQRFSGEFTDRTFQQFTAANGLTSEYHIYAAGLARTGSLCAVFQFHGDGAFEFKNPGSSYSLGGSGGIVAQSRQHGCLTVAVLTPDQSGPVTWWENGAANALFFRDLLTRIKADYNIDNERIWLVGYSGGAQFITQFYLPLYSSSIDGGGSIAFGGGGLPRVRQNPYADGLTADFHMFWYTGANDDGSTGGYNALRDAKAGEAAFAQSGFATSHEYPANTDHDLSQRFGGVVARQLDQYDTKSAIAPPLGWVDLIRPSATTVVVAGWVLDRRVGSKSIAVHIYINGIGYARPSDKNRPDVNAAYGVSGNHGFSETLPLPVGTSNICVFAIGSDPNNNSLITCQTIEGPRLPIGFVDAVTTSGSNATIAGWTFDPNSPGASIPVHAYVNDAGTAHSTDQQRGDVNNAFGISGRHGFRFPVALKPGANNVCIYGIGVTPGNNSSLGCRTVQGPVPPVGFVDSITVSGTSMAITGWALDGNSPPSSIPVHVYINGVGYAFTANRPRGDVNAALGVSGRHGFSVLVPARTDGNSVCVFAIGVSANNNTLLECRG